MRKSTFLGVTILNPGEGLDADNYAFTGRDRELIDYGVRIGAKLHRHNALDGMANPTLAPSGVAVLASGGAIPTGVTISVGYTFEDSIGGETALSPTVSVTTGQPLAVPTVAPTAVVDYASGALTTGSYYYAVSWLDGEGGETPVGPTVVAERQPGFEHAAVHLTNLNAGIASASASGYRLYRAVGGGSYELLAERAASATSFVDDGNQAVNCDVHPVADATNNTRQNNTLKAILPAKPAAQDTEPVAINLYASLGNDFAEASLLAQYPIASAGQPVSFPRLEVLPASPPDHNTSFGGANKIDPDTELIDWHWKRPVATEADLPEPAEEGDARIVLADESIWVYNGTEWKLASAGGGGESAEYTDTFPEGALDAGWAPFVDGFPFSEKESLAAKAAGLVGTEEDGGQMARSDISAHSGVVEIDYVLHPVVGSLFYEVGPVAKWIDEDNFLLMWRYEGAPYVEILGKWEGKEVINIFMRREEHPEVPGQPAEDAKTTLRLTFTATKLLFQWVNEGGGIVYSISRSLAELKEEKAGEPELEEGVEKLLLAAGHPGVFLKPEGDGEAIQVTRFKFKGEVAVPLLKVTDGTTTVSGTDDLRFAAGSGVSLAVTEPVGGEALVTIAGTGPTSGAMGVVWCGEDLTKARPTGFDSVTWITQGKGEAEPEHMAVHDLLYALP